MVSGLVASTDDQLRICFDEARPMEMASKLLMSIKTAPKGSNVGGGIQVTGGGWRVAVAKALPPADLRPATYPASPSTYSSSCSLADSSVWPPSPSVSTF